MPRKFEEITQAKPKRGVCGRCHLEPSVAQVMVYVRHLNERGQAGRQIASTSRSVCEACAVEVYEQAKGAFDEPGG